VTVALWWRWRGRRDRLHLAPLALFAAAALALLAVDAPAIASHGGLGAVLLRTSIAPLAAGLAPGLAPALGARVVVLFAFAQAVHYGVWLRLVPEDDRAQPTPRTFRKTFRALRADLSLPLLVVALLGALAVGAWAAHDLIAARAGYARFSWSHGYLELAAAALVLLERGGRVAGAPPR
jgi:hypothetical protein